MCGASGTAQTIYSFEAETPGLTGTCFLIERPQLEASGDLGAHPLATFGQVTLPLIAPALAAGWP